MQVQLLVKKCKDTIQYPRVDNFKEESQKGTTKLIAVQYNSLK